MKILFVSPDLEEKARGINMILKSLIMSAHNQGHEVGLLVGYPRGSIVGGSKGISSKINHLYLQHYLREGRKSFRYMMPGGYSIKNAFKAVFSLSVLRSSTFLVEQDHLSDNSDLLKHVDYVVQSPFYYQFLVRNYYHLPRYLLRKITKKYDVDLVICASPSMLRSKDVSSGLMAFFVHDAMPFELVETPPDNNTPAKYGKQFLNAAKNSDLILTNSEDTKDKVIGVNSQANVHVLYGTASSQKKELSTSSILEKHDLTPSNYLLFASTLEKRKNIENLMEAFALVYPDINMPLVLIGGEGYGYKDIKKKYHSLESNIRSNILFTGYVSENDKYTLFNNANSFVFPSIYEGIGLVIIEAMQAEIPVLTSNKGALPEAGGDAVLYVNNPYDTKEIADAIKEIVYNNELREKLTADGIKQSEKFTYKKFEQRFKKAIKSLG